MYKFDKGCRFAIGTGDTAKEKIEEQLGKATKAKIDPANRLTQDSEKGCKCRKKIRLILNYIHLTPFYHVYIVQPKRTNQQIIFLCESIFL